jgi:protein-S-isoprenylcysteine O-methyltransferase Ste14
MNSPKWMNDVMQWLARRRVTLGFVASVLAIWLAQPTRRSLVAGALIALAGEALRIWAAGHLEKGREVTVSGPYRLTRHPLYVGSAIMGAGVAVAAASAIVAVLVGAYLAITLTAAILTEEAHLTEKFGVAYPAYRDGRAPELHRRFSVQRAVNNREYRAVAGLALALALLAWKTL